MKRVIALLIALSFGVVFAAMKGIPKDVQGFASWKKVVTTGMALDGPHAGKNKVVYANAIAAKAWAGKAPSRARANNRRRMILVCGRAVSLL